MPHQYVFITRWQLKAPLEKVWDAIYNSMDWPDWWPGVVNVKELAPGDARGINGIREYTWKSVLPYKLRFASRLTEREDFQRLRGIASGDLEGEGSWHFFEKDGIVYLQCDWRVNTNIKWMNALSFCLRPLFKYNHSVVMKWGAKGLAKKLDAELVAYE